MEPRTDREYRRDFYRAVDVQQPSRRGQQQYYVPIYSRDGMQHYDHVPGMLDQIEFSVDQSVQFFSGFKGCGKSSELHRLADELRTRGYRVAEMDIQDFFNPLQPLNTAVLPYALAAGFARALNRDPSGTPMQRFLDFVRRVRVQGKGTVGVDLDIVQAGVEVSAYVKDDPDFAAQARSAFNHNRRTFRAEFHAFFQDLIAGLGTTEPIVFLVDSIDHFRGIGDDFETVRASVEAAFIELADDLQIPNLHVVYTVPIYLEVGLGPVRHVVNVKLATRDGDPYEPGIQALHEVLERRAPGGDLHRLLEPALSRRLILDSGGMFRDLLRLTRGLLIDATKPLPADAASLDRAGMAIRDPYTTVLTREQREILRGVDTTHELFLDKASKADETLLITMGAILRYPNDRATWFAVHPLLRSLLA